MVMFALAFCVHSIDNTFSITECSFLVQVIKNERGLGISVYGGIDTNVAFPGLIRIKRLFPNQSAWSTGMLQPGDILLESNEIALTGLTNHVSQNLTMSITRFINAYLLETGSTRGTAHHTQPCDVESMSTAGREFPQIVAAN